MKKIDNLSNELKLKILNFLYQDEVYNVFLIYQIENSSMLNHLYISEEKNEITAILNLKYDGNSYFTTFYTKDQITLYDIATQLYELSFKRILLTGKLKEIKILFTLLNIEKEIDPNLYYEFDPQLFSAKIELLKSIRKATINDIKILKPFLIDFFQAKTDKEIKEVTKFKKIKDEIKTGIYLYTHNDNVIGMARFSSRSKHYCDITTVYIHPDKRHTGHGKKLMKCMIMLALKNQLIPITQTALNNIPAKKTYESLGFRPIDDYAFEFIS